LRKTYGDILCDIDIAAALNQAAYCVWRAAGTFDPARGSLKSWFFRIAQRQAIDIIEDRQKHAGVDFDLDRYVQNENVEIPELDDQAKRRVDDLQFVITQKLEGLQQAIILADLKAFDVASADRLAAMHGTTRNSIYVSRVKARANIAKHMTEIENRRSGQGDDE